ncbi:MULTISPECIES: hypothetical protein [unclassified Pseudomonas]|uniref:hypothetical protein n=1 Tax=unclassified Pseudomonas TaxID=196821 RepID=UPI002097766F|nr:MULTISPECIES: hypothetical protein [unclassified Pseudomonas]MCO7506036.1 hypothetical protein [Pseudomonas sp. VE 267-6A]MCO7530042.1 hypothetical protein [Pseudomonas sp. 2]
MFLNGLDVKGWLVRFFGKIPFLQCLVSFPSEAHKSALRKFFALWILASLPILFAALLSPIPADGSSWALFSKLKESISVSEQFVYVASFLTPVLYIWYEKYQAAEQNIAQRFKGLFSGYGLVALSAFILMLATASAFGALKTNADSFKSTFLSLALTEYSAWVYFFALYCWYLSLVDGIPGDFVAETRKSEQSVKTGLAARLKSRGEGND